MNGFLESFVGAILGTEDEILSISRSEKRKGWLKLSVTAATLVTLLLFTLDGLTGTLELSPESLRRYPILFVTVFLFFFSLHLIIESERSRREKIEKARAADQAFRLGELSTMLITGGCEIRKAEFPEDESRMFLEVYDPRRRDLYLFEILDIRVERDVE